MIDFTVRYIQAALQRKAVSSLGICGRRVFWPLEGYRLVQLKPQSEKLEISSSHGVFLSQKSSPVDDVHGFPIENCWFGDGSLN